MQINIRTSSWHVKVFQWYFQQVSGNLPRSLCPYFWGWLLILPTLPVFLIVGAPTYLVVWTYNLFGKNKEKYVHPGLMAFTSIVGLFLLAMVFAIGKSFLRLCKGLKLTHDEFTLLVIGAIIVLAILSWQTVRLCKHLIRKTIYNDYDKWWREIGRYNNNYAGYKAEWWLWVAQNKPTSTWDLIKQGVRAVYKKACPIIHWH